MVFVVNIITRKEQAHTNLGPCQVSVEPETVLPNDLDTQNCISKNSLRRVCEVSKWKILALMGLSLTAFVALGLVLPTVLLSRKLDCTIPATSVPTNATHVFPKIPESTIRYHGHPTKKLRVVERVEWGAEPPTEPLAKLELPVSYVFISDAETDVCYTTWNCGSRVRDAQKFDMKNLTRSDISYNFMIGGNGFAYVGRGWDFAGPHTRAYNTRSITISLIGNLFVAEPPKRQLLAAQQLIELGVKNGKIDPDYKLLGNRQVQSGIRGGDALISIIKTWPHWVSL